MSNLILSSHLSQKYHGPTQKARVITENWVHENGFCPSCGSSLYQFATNKPVADFGCKKCDEEYELKSKVGKLTSTIPDGAYSTMLNRLKSLNNPSLLLLSYSTDLKVTALVAIPRYYFTPDIIKPKSPLSANARRAGWIGCSINIGSIPENGKIHIVKDGSFQVKKEVVKNWNKTSFLKASGRLETRQWLISMIKCIEKLGRKEFSLQDIYSYEKYFESVFPNNSNVRPKIRQQLQVLRDMHYLKFLGNGNYSLDF